MLSLDLATDIRRLLVELDASEPLFAALSRFVDTEQQMSPYLEQIAKGGQELNSAAGGLHGHLANARQVLPQLPSRKLYKAIERSIGALSTYAGRHPEARRLATDLGAKLEEFSSLYESYLSDQSGKSALPVLRVSAALLPRIEAARVALEELLVQLVPPDDLQVDEDVLAVYFPGTQGLADLAVKLRAIANIFELIADLVDSPTAARVLHIESGSLLIKLAIAKLVASIARPWISSLAGYFYRTRTMEGRLSASPVQAKEAIKHTLDVRQLLRKAGIDTKNMDEKIERAAVAMAENVAVLVQNQTRFTVDDAEFDSTTFVPPYLEFEPPRQQLPAPTPSPTPPPPLLK